MRLTALLLIIVMQSLCIYSAEPVFDKKSACDWCDRTMLHRIEGIWEYPDDYTSVLIKRSAAFDGRYDIVVVDSPDTRIQPGETIGYVIESAEANSFEMGVYRSKVSGILSEPGKCFAKLADNDNSLLVKGRKIKFSLGSRWLLPSFWKMIRVTMKDPLESLPRGLVRIYPLSTPRQPDYL